MSDSDAPSPIPTAIAARLQGGSEWGPRESTPLGTLPPNITSQDGQQSPPSNDTVDLEDKQSATASVSPVLERPTNPIGRDTIPSSAPQPAWHNIPGFEELDESWSPAAPSTAAMESLQRQRNQSFPASLSAGSSAVFFDARQSSSRATILQPSNGERSEGGGAEATNKEGGRRDRIQNSNKPHSIALLPRRSRATHLARGRQEEESSALTDSEVYILRPGPSSPSNRKPSHKLRGETFTSRSPSPSSAPELSTRGALDESSMGHSEFVDAQPQPASPSRSSVSSEAKQRGGEELPYDLRSTGTPPSVNRINEPPEATFIQHDVSDLPPVLQPVWKSPEKPKSRFGGDMFSPIKLQSMFEPPSPKTLSPQRLPSSSADGQQRSGKEDGRNELDHQASAPQVTSETAGAVDESEDMDLDQTPSPTASDESADEAEEESTFVVDKSAAEVESALGLASEVFEHEFTSVVGDTQNPPNVSNAPAAQVPLDPPHVTSTPPASFSPPKGQFTFCQPLSAPAGTAVLVATPGRTVAPLRLFDDLQAKQIFRDSRFRERVDALAAELDSNVNPSNKRMRVARPQSDHDLENVDDDAEVSDGDGIARFEPSSPLSAILEGDSPPHSIVRKDYVKESAGFMARMRTLSLRSDELIDSPPDPPATQYIDEEGERSSLAHEDQAAAREVQSNLDPWEDQNEQPTVPTSRRISSPAHHSAGQRGSPSRSRPVTVRSKALFTSPARSRAARPVVSPAGSDGNPRPSPKRQFHHRSSSSLPSTRAAGPFNGGAAPSVTSRENESPQKLLRQYSAAAKAATEDAQRSSSKVLPGRGFEASKESSCNDAHGRFTKSQSAQTVESSVNKSRARHRLGETIPSSPSIASRIFATTPQEAGEILRAARRPSSDNFKVLSAKDGILAEQRVASNGTDSTARTLVHHSTDGTYEKLLEVVGAASQPGTYSRSRLSSATGMLHISPDQIDIAELERMGGGSQRWDQGSQRWIRVSKRRGNTRDVFDRPGDGRSGGALRVPIDEVSHETIDDQDGKGANDILLRPTGAELLTDAETSSSNPFADIESFGNTDLAAHHQEVELSEAADAPEDEAIDGEPLLSPSPGATALRLATPKAAAPPGQPSTLPRSGSGLRNEVLPSSSETSRTDTTSSPRRLSQATMMGPPLGPSEADLFNGPTTPTRAGTSNPPQQPPRSSSIPQPPRSILKGSNVAGRVIVASDSHVTPSRAMPGVPKQPRSISFADRRTHGRLFEEHEQDRRNMKHGRSGDTTLGLDADLSGKDLAVLELLQKLADATLSEPLPLERRGEAVPSSSPDTSATAMGATSWRSAIRRSRDSRLEADDELERSRGYAADRPDMTMLTEASFRVTHDKILEYITDVVPWQPDWDHLTDIDLSGRRIESVARLKEFLPVLEEVNLDHNHISYLTGLPGSTRILSIATNRITSSVSFSHLRDIETLDISNNDIDSLAPLECLTKLRDLRADNNAIDSLYGITLLRGLHWVSLRGNRITEVDLRSSTWSKLEALDLAHNELQHVADLSNLGRLKRLDLSHNDLAEVDLGPSMRRLRELRVSGNARLASLNVQPVPYLKTLYADFCALQTIAHLGSLARLENFSLRQQLVDGILWPARELRDAKRLYFSGNAFPDGLPTRLLDMGSAMPSVIPSASETRFFNLVYLELSACQLASLPADLPSLAPNMRSLNADHNLFDVLPRLQGMGRLKRLSLVGCRLRRSSDIVTALQNLAELQVLDVRTNPCTLGLYPPVIISAVAGPGAADGVNYAHLPPIPNAQLVQPDMVEREVRSSLEAAAAEARAFEMSFFHKRVAPPDAEQHAHNAQKSLQNGRMSTPKLYLEADARFSRTLPPGFAMQRLLHRGALAMACPALTWLDGLVIDEDEVERANEAMIAGGEMNGGRKGKSGNGARAPPETDDDERGGMPRWAPTTPDFARR